MEKITPVDIQHKSFKKALQGYDRADVDGFLDEVIETLEDEAQQRAALEAEIADLKERVSHFKAVEESLQNTLVLAQRTADEVKASAHKETQSKEKSRSTRPRWTRCRNWRRSSKTARNPASAAFRAASTISRVPFLRFSATPTLRKPRQNPQPRRPPFPNRPPFA